jgi:Lipocalin-like domain
MKKMFPVGALTLFLAMAVLLGPAPCRSQNLNAGIRDRFIGAWRLAWLEEPGADGKIHRADCTGLLVFTRDSHVSVQVTYRNPQSATQSGPVQYAKGGYEASFGTYVIHERAHTFTYHVEGALVRTLVGKDLTRLYEFSGKRLIVRSPDPHEHWIAAWERR